MGFGFLLLPSGRRRPLSPRQKTPLLNSLQACTGHQVWSMHGVPCLLSVKTTAGTSPDSIIVPLLSKVDAPTSRV